MRRHVRSSERYGPPLDVVGARPPPVCARAAAQSSQLIERKPGQYRPQSARAIVIVSFRARVTHTHARAPVYTPVCGCRQHLRRPSVSRRICDVAPIRTLPPRRPFPDRCVAADAVAASLKEAASFAKCLDEVGARIRPSASSS